MSPEQAGICIATLQAYFPRFPIPDSTVKVWAAEITPLAFDDVRAAIARLATTWGDDHYPSLQAILAKTREVTGHTMSPALPSAPVDPDEARAAQERMHALVEGFFEGRTDEHVRAKIAAGTATFEELEAFNRHHAQAVLDNTDPLPELPKREGGKVPTPCPVGARAEVRDGVLVCPHCGEPVRDGEGRVMRAKEEAKARD